MENSAHWCIPTGAHTSSADGGCPDTQGSTSRKQQALSKCRLFPGLKSLDPALPFWGPELRAILEGSSVGREWLGQAGRNSPQGLTCECSGKEGWRKGGAGKWARRAGALALQAGPSSVEEPAARGLKMPLFQLSTQEAWEGGAGSCAALVLWTQLPARPSPSLISVPPPASPDEGCVCWGGGEGVCVCVWSKLFTLCKYIRKKFFMEVAPGRTEVSLGEEVAIATQGFPHLPHAQVLDDVLEQLHGAHDVLILRGERGREAWSALGGAHLQPHCARGLIRDLWPSRDSARLIGRRRSR